MLEGNFKLLDELHHFTSGIKAIATSYAYTGIDELRQACGGAGFTLASGIADIWQDIAPYSTFEGVNVVMAQQSSRYVLKQAKKAAKGQECTGFFSYINHLNSVCNSKSEAKTAAQFSSIDHLDLAMKINAASQLKRTFELLNSSDKHEKIKQNDIFADEVQRLTQLHLKYVMFMMARQRIEENNFADPAIPQILLLLIRVYALKEILRDNQLLYEEGFFGKGSVKLLNDAFNETLLELRPHMIPLVELTDLSKEDAWNVSTIGNKFGDIYET